MNLILEYIIEGYDHKGTFVKEIIDPATGKTTRVYECDVTPMPEATKLLEEK